MKINSQNIVYYLLEQGAVTVESVVDGDFMVVDASRRHRDYKVIRKQKPSYFLKQSQKEDPRSIASLQREATCYWLANYDADFAPLAALLPNYYLYDAKRNVLLVELLPEGENLSEYHRRVESFPLEVASMLGRMLGIYHRQVGSRWKDQAQNTVFPKALPWILAVHRYTPLQFDTFSGANSQLLQIVKQYPEFQAELDKISAQWQVNSLIHGDMKWDNCVVYPNSAEDGSLSLKIVDWELADFGDACWDVGSIFQAYLGFWILSMQITHNASPAHWMEQARYSIEEIQPAMRSFWEAYIGTLQIPGSAVTQLLNRSVKYGAARMIQTVYEYMSYSQEITPNALCMLQLSMNILTKTEEAVRELIGIREQK